MLAERPSLGPVAVLAFAGSTKVVPRSIRFVDPALGCLFLEPRLHTTDQQTRDRQAAAR